RAARTAPPHRPSRNPRGGGLPHGVALLRRRLVHHRRCLPRSRRLHRPLIAMTTSAHLPDPVPLEPRHAHLVDGAHVVLRWEPVAVADYYRVQIARDVAFEDLVLEERLPAAMTALIVRQHSRK